MDFDKKPELANRTGPDYLPASDHGGSWIVPIEIKKDAPDVPHALKQLQAGGHLVQEMVAAGKVDDFRAVLVSGSLGK